MPPFGVSNDDEGFYKKYRTEDTERDALFLIKANAPVNTEIYSYVQTQLLSHKLKFLIDEGQAKVKLMATKMGQAMSPEKRAEHLRPFVQTSILHEQMSNLVEESESLNIILKQSTRGIGKDKFSAYSYGLYFIKKEEDKNKKRRSRNFAEMMFFG